MNVPGPSFTQSIPFYRARAQPLLSRPAFSAGIATWGVAELALFDKDREVHLAGPYHFSSAWMSAGSGEEWVYVDLGALCTFDRVTLAWIRRAAEGSIQVSNDATQLADAPAVAGERRAQRRHPSRAARAWPLCSRSDDQARAIRATVTSSASLKSMDAAGRWPQPKPRRAAEVRRHAQSGRGQLASAAGLACAGQRRTNLAAGLCQPGLDDRHRSRNGAHQLSQRRRHPRPQLRRQPVRRSPTPSSAPTSGIATNSSRPRSTIRSSISGSTSTASTGRPKSI